VNFNPNFCFNERDVESKLIVQYLLPALGYTPDTWHQEVEFGSIRLDFIVFASQVIPFAFGSNSPLSLVIEAKHPTQDLNKHVNQLKGYLTKLKVSLGVLTNGKEIRIYKLEKLGLDLIFRCFGKDAENEIGLIKEMIGRENLQSKSLGLSSAVTSSIAHHSASTTAKSKTNITQGERNMKIIAIYHNKGGVGKTTVAVNLAAALSNKGKKVLLIDIDAQANSTFATGLIKFQFEEDDNIKDNNIFHLVESGDFNFVSDLVKKSKLFNSPEIDVIPSHITLVEKQEKLTRTAASRFRLDSKLKKAQDDYDIVIIDAPPSRDVYSEIALIAADYLIIPSDLKPFSNQGLATVKSFVNEINETRTSIGKNELEIIGVLPSKILTNSRYLASTFPRQKDVVSSRYGLALMESIIFERIALSGCINKTIEVGSLEIPDPKSIFEYERDSDSAKEFRNLASEVLNKIGE
jgi:chromosome partitioning protein